MNVTEISLIRRLETAFVKPFGEVVVEGIWRATGCRIHYSKAVPDSGVFVIMCGSKFMILQALFGFKASTHLGSSFLNLQELISSRIPRLWLV